MDACDLVVIPSRWEDFGYVALEAMRAEKPVLASNVGGLKDIVVDGQTGYLFAPEEAQTLAKLLKKARQMDLSAMGRRGRAVFMEKFTASRMATAYLDLYRRALEER